MINQYHGLHSDSGRLVTLQRDETITQLSEHLLID